MPVIHSGYSKTIKDILNATHPSSGRLMLTQDRIDHYTKQIRALMDSDAVPLFLSVELQREQLEKQQNQRVASLR